MSNLTPAQRLRQIQAKHQGASALQVPLWPVQVRPLPNTAARGALFTAANKREPRLQHRKQLVATTAQARIFHTGEELRQFDQTVWLQLVHQARSAPLGSEVESSFYAVLTSMGLSTGGRDSARVRHAIDRMVEATLWVYRRQDSEIASSGWTVEAPADDPQEDRIPAYFNGRLVATFRTDGGRSGAASFFYSLDPKIVRLFGVEDYSLVEWEQRLKLSPLAQWAHSFYHSHARPVPYALATLLALSGTRAVQRSFRTSFTNALEQLKDVGFLADYDIRDGLVHVARAARQG